MKYLKDISYVPFTCNPTMAASILWCSHEMLSAPLGGSDMIAYSNWHRGQCWLPATPCNQFGRIEFV